MAKRDRLDGTKRKNILFEFYLLPGRILLWMNYMFPSKGYNKTRESARHARSPIMTFFYATILWLVFVFLVVLPALDAYGIIDMPYESTETPNQ